MTTNAGQAATQDPLDAVLKALLKELSETGSQPKAALRAGGAVKAALDETLLVAMARTVSEASPFERAVLVAALAPAIAEALAPALAQALAPALATALSNMATTKKTSQGSDSGEGFDHQEGE